MAMFGGLAFLIDRHMAVGASGKGGLVLRAAPDDHSHLLQRPAIEPMMMKGRPMTGWLRVADEAITTDRELRELVAGAVAFARSLPPKAERRRSPTGP